MNQLLEYTVTKFQEDVFLKLNPIDLERANTLITLRTFQIRLGIFSRTIDQAIRNPR